MAATPEGDTKEVIKKFLNRLKIWYVMVIPSTYGRSTGISDFQVLYKGVFIVIEAKRGDKPADPTPNQAKYMGSVVANGGYAFVVRNEDDLLPIADLIDKIDVGNV